jgi:predicted outer membrane repeat protein
MAYSTGHRTNKEKKAWSVRSTSAGLTGGAIKAKDLSLKTIIEY